MNFATASILHYSLGGAQLVDWLIVVGLALFGWGLGHGVSFVLQRLMARLADKLSLRAIVLRSVSKPIMFLLILLGAYIGLSLLPASDKLSSALEHVFIVLKACSVWVVIWVLLIMTDGFAERFIKRAEGTESKLDDMLTPIIATTVKILLIAIGILMILQNLGYSITSLVAGLGLGGAAIALAAKDTIANIFGSLVVFLDEPFQLGDWVEVNGVEGTVEEIRLRTTLVRTFDNSLVTMPNSLLTNTNINNFDRRIKRKMDCSFGVLYSTKSEQVTAIVEDVKKFLEENSATYVGPNWVALDAFGASSLDISVITYSQATEKAQHMADKQRFLVAIMRIVEQHGSDFAFPTRTIDIRQIPDLTQFTKRA